MPKKFPKFFFYIFTFSLFFLLFSNPVKAETIYPYWIDENLDVWTKVNLTANSNFTLYILKTSGYSPNGDDVFDYFADFESASSPSDEGIIEDTTGWSVVDSGVSELGKVLQGDPSVPDGEMYCHFGPTMTNYEVRVKIYAPASPARGDVLGRFVDTDNLISINWLEDDDQLNPYKKVSGTWTNLLGSGNHWYTTINAQTTYIAKLRFLNDNVTYIWVNSSGEYVLGSFTVTEMASGGALDDGVGGLRVAPPTVSGKVWYDEIWMRKYTSPEPSVTIYDEGSYYKVVIEEQSGSDLTNYQIKLDGSQLGISSTSESLKISDTPPTENLPPTIEISSPQNTTYYTTSLNLKFKVTDDNSTTFWVKAYFENQLIYENQSYENNTEITLNLSSYLNDSKETWFIKVWANDTDSQNPQTSEKTVYFTLDLFDLSASFNNYVTYNNENYAKTLSLEYSARCGYLGKSIWLNITANNSVIYSHSITCDNSTYSFSQNYQHPNEGNLTIQISLYKSDNSTIAESQSFTYFSDLNPPTITISYNFTYGFRSNIQEQVNFSVSDSISPIQFCDLIINSQSYENVSFGNNQTSYNFNLIDGYNEFKATCKDLVNNQASNSSTKKVWLKKFILIEEDSGNTFSSFGEMDTLRAISEKTQEIYDFLDKNDTEIYFASPEVDVIRFEKRYADSPNDLLYIDLNLDLIESETRICVAKPQTFYEIVFYSSTNKPIAVKNNLGQCYVLADYTKYAYQDALMAKAYTIKSLYYLYTYDNNQKVFLATIDGSVATSVALDVLESTQKSYTFSLTTDDISISKYTNTTLKIYYKNLNNDNSRVEIQILDGSNVIFSHTETENPNEFTLYFDYSTLNLQNNLLKIVLTKYRNDGSISTISRVFNLSGASGLLHPMIAIAFSTILIFFSLTFVAIRYVFGWFGMISLIVALAITTLAPPTPELTLIQVLIIIMLVFIALIYKEEHAKVT